MASNYAAKYSNLINQNYAWNGVNQVNIYSAGPTDVMDLRERAIESMDDFMTLLHREKQRNNPIRRAIVTPEQANILMNDPAVLQQARYSNMIANAMPVAFSLYGVDVEVKR